MVSAENPLRVAMLGMIPGNGHPYSWSAIINGYHREAMAKCPYPVIAEYLNAEPEGSVGLDYAKVTHIWTDNPEEAPLVAEASKIPNVVKSPEDVIGAVDVAIISTDDGDDHVERARPFIEAGLPVFIDKPLATNVPDLKQFTQWRREGKVIVSSSGVRYAPELEELKGQDWRWITGITAKTWKRYGIHVLEPIFVLSGPGFETVRASHRGTAYCAHLQHASGLEVTIAAIEEAAGSFGTFHAYGNAEQKMIRTRSTYRAFRGQLTAFLEFIAGWKPEPQPFVHTRELMAALIAGDRSVEAGGVAISIQDILQESEP